MNSNVDLQGLAVDRSAQAAGPARRHLLTRYVLPGVLILGFLALLAWAARDYVFPPRTVTVVPVFSTTSQLRQEGAPLFNAAGWIEPRPTPVRVAALAPGVVETLLVVEDQRVRAGEPLAELVKDDAQLELDRAVANLELNVAQADEARAALVAAKTRFEQPVHLEADLGEAEAALAKLDTQLTDLPFEVRRAEAEQEAAQKDFEGKANSAGVVPQVEIDIAMSKVAAAKALVEELRRRSSSLATEKAAQAQRRDALRTRLKLLADEIHAVGKAEAQMRAAEARIAQMQVAIAQAKLQYERMTVVSPIAGRVFRLIAHPGTRIGGGGGMTQMAGHDGSTVVTLYRPDMLQIRVDVRFEDIPRVSLDQSVEINNPALPSPIVGRVLFVSSEADIQKNTLQVKVAIPDPPSYFKPEMLVDATFLAPKQISPSIKNDRVVRIYVLQQLVLHDDDGAFVWVVDQSQGVARRKRVQTGSVGSNGLMEITEGLSATSRIIARNADGLADGDRVRVGDASALDAAPTQAPNSGSTSTDRTPLNGGAD